MVAKPPTRSSALAADLKNEVLSAMNADSSLTPHGAMLKITKEMLANNPFVTPSGCPVNALPPELLAHIFVLGARMEEEEWDEVEEDEEDEELCAAEFDLRDGWTDEEDVDPDELDAAVVARLKAKGKVQQRVDGAMDVDGDDESDEEDGDEEGDEMLPQFQVLVSHVCRHWREVAIETPELWTRLTFTEGAPYEKSLVWIQRAKGGPLDIDIDCAEDEDVDLDATGDWDESMLALSDSHPAHTEQCASKDCGLSIRGHDLKQILNIIIPLVAQWRSFDVTTATWDDMHMLLSRLSECPSAPLLETLGLYHCEDNEDYDTFHPAKLKEPMLILNGNAPNLRNVLLWGVHLDWDRSLTLLSDLHQLKLSYHAEDVRPSFATFTKIISSSPNLRILDLSLSGPREQHSWGTDVIEIPSLVDLVFCYHKPSYAIALLKLLSVPNVHNLAIDFDEEDYTAVVKQLALPMAKTNKSILAGLEHMKISGLPCNREGIDLMLKQLAGLKTLNINCSNEEEREIFNQLFPTKVTSGGSTAQNQRIYCPNLYKIIATGVSGSDMCSFIMARNAAGVPIKEVMMSEEDEINEREIKWLREHVEELDFFEPSDEEYEEEYLQDEEEYEGLLGDAMDDE